MSFEFPKSFTSGDSLEVSFICSDYLPSDGWVSSLSIRGASALDINGDFQADRFNFALSTSQTASLIPGMYAVSLYVHRNQTRKTIAVCLTTCTQNLVATSTGYDPRSAAKRMLDALDAMLEKRASSEIQAMSVTFGDGTARQMSTMTYSELLGARNYYQEIYNQELQSAQTGLAEVGYFNFVYR